MAGMPRIEAVAFDCDGLMFNTEESFNVAGRELLRRRGHDLTPEVLRLMMGRRATEAFDALVTNLRLTDPPEVLQQEYEGLFRAALEGRLNVMPGLLDLLTLIEDRGLPKAVCTSSHRGHLQRVLGRFGLSSRFDTTLTAEDVLHGKPHPEIYLTAAKRLDVSPERLLVLEDSENGTKAAVAAGAVAVSVPHEHSSYQDFASAWLVADTLADAKLVALVEAAGRTAAGPADLPSARSSA